MEITEGVAKCPICGTTNRWVKRIRHNPDLRDRIEYLKSSKYIGETVIYDNNGHVTENDIRIWCKCCGHKVINRYRNDYATMTSQMSFRGV